MNTIEIEHKFLVCGDFRPFSVHSDHIIQGYVCSGGGKTVRVRIRGDKGYLTIKGPADEKGLSRFEWEKEITVEEAKALLPQCGGKFIEKVRHLVPYSGHTFEVDVFEGENEGLVVAEVELSYENEPFEKPQWCGKDVSADKRYRNSYLNNHPYREWQK